MINSTEFGSITIDAKTYNHDVWIFADGRIEKRTKNHLFEEGELDLLAKDNPEIIVIGTGQSGIMRVSVDAKEKAEQIGIKLIAEITPAAIKKYNELAKKKKVAAAMHITC